jgi:hypothetical protein
VPIPQIPFPRKEEITKESLGVQNESYVLAVVGKEFTRRLQSERKSGLSLEFARALVGLLEAEPGLSVLLIGEDPALIAEWFKKAEVAPDPSRCKVVEFAADLRSTMLACDLIVNPPMRGGGRGIALAVSDKLPVLIFPDADAANFVPPANIARDMTDFVLKVWRYFRRGAGQREAYVSQSGVIPFSDEYNAAAGQAFVGAARVAVALGRQRLFPAA